MFTPDQGTALTQVSEYFTKIWTAYRERFDGLLNLLEWPSSRLPAKRSLSSIGRGRRLSQRSRRCSGRPSLTARRCARGDLKAFKSQLGRLSIPPPGKTTFQMKEINVCVRQYFHPWRVSEEAKDFIGHDLLLVDDLIGSGASLSTCAKCLVENGHSVVGGVSLFSPLDRELSKKPKGARHKRHRGRKP